MEKYEITIKVDTNNADYIIEINKINQKDLNDIMPLIKSIKSFSVLHPYKHNYMYGEFEPDTHRGDKSPRDLYNHDEEIFDIFEEYLPYSMGGGHTIESITISPVVKKTRLL